MNYLKINFLMVDFGFIFYWIITYFEVIPAEYLYTNYHNEILVNWNWSFLPIDIFVSFTGITSLYLLNRKKILWKYFAIMSLCLTHASGLMAISFWVLQGYFDLSWWIPNLYLLIYPIPVIIFILGKNQDF